MRECTKCLNKKELEKFVKNGPYYRYICSECWNYRRRKNKERSGPMKKGEGYWLGKKLTSEVRKKIGDTQRGRKQNSEIIEKRRLAILGQRRKETRHASRKYWEWKNAVKERDGWICQHCKCNEKERMHAHHIVTWEKDPSLRFDLSNGITLCKNCHAKEHTKHKIGKSFSKETEFKKGQVAHNKGMKISLELKEKLINSRLGKAPWNKDKKGQIPWNKGKKGLQVAWNKDIPRTDQQKKAHSEKMKGRTAWNKGLKKYVANSCTINE